MRVITIVALTLGGGASSLAAQHPHQFEVGAFGSYTRYDQAFNLANKIGGGARIGYLFGDVVGVEADVLFEPRYSVAISGTPTTLEPLIGSASLVFNALNGDRLMVYVLAGYSLLDFGTRTPYHFTDHAIHGALGTRIFLSDRVALRLEARSIFAPKTQSSFGPTTPMHIVGTAGLSVFHLGGSPRDSDKDDVPDRKDACSNTPAGTTVDQRGCPMDSDHDGVYDGIDRCPGTPAGLRVDATGCPTDADGDGVPDDLDQCPNTPAGTHVDAGGCPTDGDGDGVPDGIDRCPNTPGRATVDAAGCPLDLDLDGVPDGIDRCPNTPSGTAVDVAGCPVAKEIVRDADGDGVPDTVDKCSNTPPGTKVDAVGCPPLFRTERGVERGAVVLHGVTFETGKSALTRESYAVLDQVAASLVANPDVRIEVAGYTDIRGSRALNLRLSQARAAAVRAYLARKGVDPARMIAKGYGATGFVASNSTAAGRAQNRRVELHKLP